MPPADRPQEPESLQAAVQAEWPRWPIRNDTDAVRYLRDAAEHGGPIGRAAVDLLLNRVDLLRATCQERDTLRRALAEVVACYDGQEAGPIGSYSRTEAAMAAARAVLREVPAKPSSTS